jgi:hypothetical protein
VKLKQLKHEVNIYFVERNNPPEGEGVHMKSTICAQILHRRFETHPKELEGLMREREALPSLGGTLGE